MVDGLVKSASANMDKSLEHLRDELGGLRGARASAGLLEHVRAEVYGQMTPLKALGSISAPDARTLLIQVWDKSNVSAIEKAITDDSQLGLNPNTEGTMIRLNLPALTEQRRNQLIKLVSERVEAAKVSLRNARHEAINEARRQQKAKTITDDDKHSMEVSLNRLIEEKNRQADELFEAKKRELMEI